MAGESISNPVKWEKVVLGGNIIAGDTIWLKDGTYSSANLYFEGTLENPIIVKPINPGSVTIDGSIYAYCTYTHFYDINFTDSNVDRFVLTNGVYSPSGTNCFYGCIFSDLHSSGLSWMGSGAGEVCENIFLNNGDRYADGSYHGHGVYTHNHSGGTRLIARNIFFDQFGSYALQIYSSSNHLKDYIVEDNITHQQPTHTGGGGGLTDFIYRRNIQYGQYIQQGRYTYDGQNNTGAITDNVTFGLTSYTVNADSNNEWLNLTESGNTVYGGEPSARAGYTVESQPATWTRVIQFSKSARWLASVAIFNRDSATTVEVDFSGTLSNGDYLLRNAQNPAETWAFSYSGSAVAVPMNIWSTAQRIGDSLPTTTYPVFGAFVVES